MARDGLRRKRRVRKRRFDLRKALFVLPNLFTVSSIFCGFYAVTLCMGSPTPFDLRRAALAIFFGMFFDGIDGRVARMTRTQSEFGVQLDSLADVISFGAAPGLLLYAWSLKELGPLGLFVAFLYVTCGALRLARFNVLAGRESAEAAHGHAHTPTRYFVGLPIPLAAGAVVALVLASYTEPIFDPNGILIVSIVLALLMVSTIRYRTFKDVRPNKKSIAVFSLILIPFIAISVLARPEIALALLFLGYILFGIIGGMFALPRSLKERAAAARAAGSTAPGPDDADA